MVVRVRPNPSVLKWAIERDGIDVESLSRAFPKLDGWLDGSAQPTLKQLEKFSERVHIGLPLLFGAEAPNLSLQIPDFRTLGASGLSGLPSPELYDTINEMTNRQDWLRDYFAEEGLDPLGFVGSAAGYPRIDQSVRALALEMHEILGLPQMWARDTGSESEAIRVLRSAMEAQRVSVVINGVVGDNTRRPLSVEEFRGFVLADDLAPLVFINGRDAKSAQLFTLAHEFAHLLFANTGVGDASGETPVEGAGSSISVERLCDMVAAEFLVPESSFRVFWGRAVGGVARRCEKAARTYRVSFLVCARRALECGLATRSEYVEGKAAHEREVASVARRGQGGNYYATKRSRIGRVFGEAVYLAVRYERLLYADAYRMTGLNAKTFREYCAENFGELAA